MPSAKPARQSRKSNKSLEPAIAPVARNQGTTKTVNFQLPPAHSWEQLKLISAWDARFDPAQDPNPITAIPLISPEDHPNFHNLPLMFPGLRFIVGACGTKFGKTYGCSIRLVKEAWENPGTTNWWVAPIYSQAENAYNFILTLLPTPQVAGFTCYVEHKSKLKIELLNPDGTHRSWIEFKSGDKPGSLRGFAVNFFVIDEAVYFDYKSFVSVVTTTTQTGGRGIIISTPKGRSWFYDVYQRGIKRRLMPGEVDEWEEWYSLRMPTWVNPHVPVKNIMQAKKNLPADVFRQEFAAEFLSESAGVFRNILGCATRGANPDDPLVPENPIPGHRYVIGVDLARLKDFTVFIVIDCTPGRNHVVYFDRFQGTAWDVVKARAIELAHRYNYAKVMMDATGLGDPIVEDVRLGGVNVEGYKISGPTQKQQLIEKLRVGMEQSKLTYPPIPVLIHELEYYEYEIVGAHVRYSAPPGKHDDCVIALALAWWAADSAPWVYRHEQRRV